MSNQFRAFRIVKGETGHGVSLTTLSDADLMAGDVDVRVSHSTLNYKDGLALTGKAPIARISPLIPGIDFAGTVTRSENPDFAPGDAVLLNGWGVGESHHGGLSEMARVKGDWLLKIPYGLSAVRTMAIGTAGYTAMLCVMALEEAGITPDGGEILVTGAAGGVGSVAIALLAKLGFSITAATGRAAREADYLGDLGASAIIDRAELAGPARPLGKERWAAGIDVAGSHTLANMLSQIRYGGAVAACGLAQGMDLPSSVAPFILRGVRLIGVDSVMCPKARRKIAWDRLARDLDLEKLDAMTRQIDLDAVPDFAAELIAGRVRGRLVVEVQR